jgi:hypothetical protein
MSADPWADARQEAARRERLRKAAVRLLESIDGCTGGGPYRYEDRADEVVDALADIFDELSEPPGGSF